MFRFKLDVILMNGPFHLSPLTLHEHILTIVLINIQYLYHTRGVHFKKISYTLSDKSRKISKKSQKLQKNWKIHRTIFKNL